jgi:hypothetical protein
MVEMAKAQGRKALRPLELHQMGELDLLENLAIIDLRLFPPFIRIRLRVAGALPPVIHRS